MTGFKSLTVVVMALVVLAACGQRSDPLTSAGSRVESTSASTGSTASRPVTGRVCRREDVAVVGNRAQYFLGDVQEASLHVTGGEADPLGCAYDQLCQAIRDRVPEEQFRATKGVAVSSALNADTESGARHGDFEQVGVDVQYDDMKTLDPAITTAWENVDFKWYGSGTSRIETWRLDFTREDGVWRVCGFTRAS